MKSRSLLTIAFTLAFAASLQAASLKIGYSERPGAALLEIAAEKGWFKEAGLEVELAASGYLASLDAFAAGKLDAVAVAGADALSAGASGSKSKIIAPLARGQGADAIIGAPGVESIGDLHGKKVGIEIALVGHGLLLQALKANGMKQSDIELVSTPLAEVASLLASGKVAAVAAWDPVGERVLKEVAGAKKLFTSADAKIPIFDVLAVQPASFAKDKSAWAKVATIYYRCVAYAQDPQTADEAVKIISAKASVDVAEYAALLGRTHLLTRTEAKAAFRKGGAGDSLSSALAAADRLNVENKLYKVSQKPENYLVPGLLEALK